MAIFIPNMEMPETCSGCSFQCDCIQCNITDTNFWDKAKEVYFDFTRERLPDCPLIDMDDKKFRAIVRLSEMTPSKIISAWIDENLMDIEDV